MANRNPGCMLFATPYSLFAIRCSLFAVRCSLFAHFRFRDALRPGFETFLHPSTPMRGVGGAPKDDWRVEDVPWCPARRRLRGAGRTLPPEGTPASRRFTRGGFGLRGRSVRPSCRDLKENTDGSERQPP